MGHLVGTACRYEENGRACRTSIVENDEAREMRLFGVSTVDKTDRKRRVVRE